MSPGTIAQLLIILAPILKEGVVEGERLVATFRDDLNADQLRTALMTSLSATWPELNFGSAQSADSGR
jgi:hypothetical protein